MVALLLLCLRVSVCLCVRGCMCVCVCVCVCALARTYVFVYMWSVSVFTLSLLSLVHFEMYDIRNLSELFPVKTHGTPGRLVGRSTGWLISQVSKLGI